jgi:hypothetical protein
MFLACQQSKVTIKLNFYYSNLKKCRGNCQNCRRQVFIDRYKIAVQWRRVRGGHAPPIVETRRKIVNVVGNCQSCRRGAG